MWLSTPIEKIGRITPYYQKRLKRLGINTVEDLIFHFPFRYEDFSKIIPISEIKLGEKCCIQGKLLEIRNQKSPLKKIIITKAVVGDISGAIEVVWFNQPYLVHTLKKGDYVALVGKVNLGKSGFFLSNPLFERVLPDKELIHTGRIVPIYPETEGLSSKWLRYIIKLILKRTIKKVKEFLPSEILEKENLLPMEKALTHIHFPESFEILKRARKRFSFQDVFLIQLRVLMERLKLRRCKAWEIPIDIPLIRKFLKSLPFELTRAQKRVLWEILKDMQRDYPMNRLLQGDVGSGKTIVAIIASLNVSQSGHQAVLMAPTEILAKQHFHTFTQFLSPFSVRIGLLTSKDRMINGERFSKSLFLEKVKEKEIDILIGTHALLSEGVHFSKLALVILDEQHRFGVEQRSKLVDGSSLGHGGKIPHLLSMSATPIPRTLSLTLYGDLDFSIIDEMPKGRKKVLTKIVTPKQREKVFQFMRKELQKKKQAFVICPRIEAEETAEDVKTVKKEYEKLSKKIFSEFKVGMLHGKMRNPEKEKVMEAFQENKISILVSTSVVEVGIDIPNATMMVIESAEKFGLAQLHQLRGRVGRREDQGFCFLFVENISPNVVRRLKALVKSQNGLELAQQDLEIRGPGEIFGVRQWGIPDVAMEGIKDVELVERARSWAKEILQKDPFLSHYPLLRLKLKKLERRIHLE